MENATTSSLTRTKSDQLVELAAASSKSPPSSESIGVAEGGGTLSSRRMMAASPGPSGGKNTHIRKARSAQLKVELDEVSSGAALSRASSASLGLSFSFTGFTVPSDEIADSKPFSDEDIRDERGSFAIFGLQLALRGVKGFDHTLSKFTSLIWLNLSCILGSGHVILESIAFSYGVLVGSNLTCNLRD